MSLEEKIMAEMKTAMKAKDSVALTSLRAIKSAILLAKTETGADSIDEATEMKIVQKMAKQRADSAKEFKDNNREDLAEKELAELVIIEKFLPAQMSDEEVEAAVKAIIAQTGASSMGDMGKVMGMASKQLAGKADNGKISQFVKKVLSA